MTDRSSAGAAADESAVELAGPSSHQMHHGKRRGDVVCETSVSKEARVRHEGGGRSTGSSGGVGGHVESGEGGGGGGSVEVAATVDAPALDPPCYILMHSLSKK